MDIFKQGIITLLSTTLVLLAILSSYASASDNSTIYTSMHYGVFSSSGLDIVGQEAKSLIEEGLYSYYGFVLPSIVTAGLVYYENYNSDGVLIKLGFGAGTLFNSSFSYQWKVDNGRFVEAGIGYGLLFEGKGIVPVISYVVPL